MAPPFDSIELVKSWGRLPPTPGLRFLVPPKGSQYWWPEDEAPHDQAAGKPPYDQEDPFLLFAAPDRNTLVKEEVGKMKFLTIVLFVLAVVVAGCGAKR